MLTYLASMLGTINLLLYFGTVFLVMAVFLILMHIFIEKKLPDQITKETAKKILLFLAILLTLNVVVPSESTLIQIINGAQ